MNDRLPDGATPLDPDDLDELMPAHLTTRGELNGWEQDNIVSAERWLLGRPVGDTLDEAFVIELHRRMFDQTWRWVGRYRRRITNIGAPPHQIPIALRELLDDGRFWRANGTWSPEEAAVRLHHRIVQVHCFPNGNGRHGRLWADVMIERQSRARLSWGGTMLDVEGEGRQRYLAALRAADAGDYAPLLAFAI